MSKSNSLHKINIRPGVTVLSVLKHLNYKPWFALAEFVDNSIQSYLTNKKHLFALGGKSYRSQIEIECSDTTVIIRDNAGGIARADFPRAFRPAELPPNSSGLCEFGMGMKSAAFWFSSKWRLRTCALGESVERSVELDIDPIMSSQAEEIEVREIKAPSSAEHFTELSLLKLHQPLHAQTIRRIREHLASIYREFLRAEPIDIIVGGEPLTYEEPKVLQAPYFKDPSGSKYTWSKSITFDFGRGLRVNGFAALFETGSTSRAGFALFRRGRLIQGSVDDGYRPYQIFGNPNDYTYQRLFGELHLEGFDVSHTKDGFRWENNEEVFLELLREHLDSAPLPLLKQAEGHRAKLQGKDFRRAAETVVNKTAQTLKENVAPIIAEQEKTPETKPTPTTLPEAEETVSMREIEVDVDKVKWLIRIELVSDPAIGDWLSVSDKSERIQKEGDRRLLALRLCLAHPFMQQFCGTSGKELEPVLRIAAALGLAETTARSAGVKMCGTIRRNVNDLLRNALSKP